jgi:hypothetical protein
MKGADAPALERACATAVASDSLRRAAERAMDRMVLRELGLAQ